MTIYEIRQLLLDKDIAPKTPEQAKIDGLKRAKDSAAKNLQAERDRQRLISAQKKMQQNLAKTPKI